MTEVFAYFIVRQFSEQIDTSLSSDYVTFFVWLKSSNLVVYLSVHRVWTATCCGKVAGAAV